MVNERPPMTQPDAEELSRERRLRLDKTSNVPSPSPEAGAPGYAPGNETEQRYLAMERARAERRRLGALESAALKTTISRPNPLRMNTFGGRLPEREGETEQDETGARRGGRPWQESARMALARLRQKPGQGANAGLSMKDAVALAKNPTPSGLAFKLATPAGGTGPGGVPMSEQELKTMVGNALIKMSWSNLWITFGHSIYVIDLLFFAGFASKYLRQYIPEIGKEWFPGDLGRKMPAHALLPIKLGEIVAMVLITLLVFLLDLALLAMLGFLIAALMDAGRAVDSIPLP